MRSWSVSGTEALPTDQLIRASAGQPAAVLLLSTKHGIENTHRQYVNKVKHYTNTYHTDDNVRCATSRSKPVHIWGAACVKGVSNFIC